MEEVYLKRIERGDEQTLGVLIYGDLTCKTLELPWLDNERRISCIPNGTYEVVKRWSEKYGDHFHVLDVPNRSYILIHSGNYNKDTLGCILVGEKHIDINGDGEDDVTNSRNTLSELNSALPQRFTLEIG